MILDKLFPLYHRHAMKLLVCSLLLLVCVLLVLGVKYVQTGHVIERGVSLKGGITLTVPVEMSVVPDELRVLLSAALPQGDINVRGISDGGVIHSLIIEASDVSEQELLDAVGAQGVPVVKGEYSLEIMGSSLGENFFRQTVFAVVIAFVCMGVVVYLTFRDLVPSLFVILCAFSDIVATLAVVSLLGVKLSTAGIGAFLMLIGYSVDTDILLTTRVLKRREGSLEECIESSMRTGLLMSVTSIAAVLVGFLFTQSDVIRQIMLVLLIGLMFDIVFTWAQNAGILRWYLSRSR